MAEEYELVGIGRHQIGGMEGWCVTYQVAPAPTENDIPEFRHHLFPAVILKNYADQFGLDIDNDDDLDEIIDILLHDGFAGSENLMDDADGPEDAFKGASDRKNGIGRKMRRRADRAKKTVTVTGIQLVRDRLRAERYTGVDDLKSRIERLEKHRARGPAASGNRSHQGDRATEAPDR